VRDPSGLSEGKGLRKSPTITERRTVQEGGGGKRKERKELLAYLRHRIPERTGSITGRGRIWLGQKKAMREGELFE